MNPFYHKVVVKNERKESLGLPSDDTQKVDEAACRSQVMVQIARNGKLCVQKSGYECLAGFLPEIPFPGLMVGTHGPRHQRDDLRCPRCDVFCHQAGVVLEGTDVVKPVVCEMRARRPVVASCRTEQVPTDAERNQQNNDRQVFEQLHALCYWKCKDNKKRDTIKNIRLKNRMELFSLKQRCFSSSNSGFISAFQKSLHLLTVLVEGAAAGCR